MEGILLVDKPKQWTSNDLCQYLKRKFKLKKVGHAGTLDPDATGVMILLINGATKKSDLFLTQEKTYTGTVQLGIQTTTQDVQGEVVQELPFDHVTEEAIQNLPSQFQGEVLQVPPMVSAKKIKGIRLYRLARSGKVVERPARKVTIFDFQIQDIAIPRFDFQVCVSKGFYVRTLAEDLGRALGTVGALASLRRVKSGSFSIDACHDWKKIQEMKSIQDLESLLVVPEGIGSLI